MHAHSMCGCVVAVSAVRCVSCRSCKSQHVVVAHFGHVVQPVYKNVSLPGAGYAMLVLLPFD
jgi:hypothetical protein